MILVTGLTNDYLSSFCLHLFIIILIKSFLLSRPSPLLSPLFIRSSKPSSETGCAKLNITCLNTSFVMKPQASLSKISNKSSSCRSGVIRGFCWRLIILINSQISMIPSLLMSTTETIWATSSGLGFKPIHSRTSGSSSTVIIPSPFWSKSLKACSYPWISCQLRLTGIGSSFKTFLSFGFFLASTASWNSGWSRRFDIAPLMPFRSTEIFVSLNQLYGSNQIELLISYHLSTISSL